LAVAAAIGMLAAGCLVWATVRQLRAGNRAAAVPPVVLIAGFFLSLGFAAATDLNFLPRHAIFLAAPLFLSLPLGVMTAIGSPEARFPKFMALVALVGLIGLNAVSTGNYYLDPSHAKDDYRSATAYLLQQRSDGGVSVLLWGQPDLLAYYGDRQTIDGREWELDEVGESMWAVGAEASELVVFINRDFYWHPQGSAFLRAQLSPRFVVVEERAFPYVDVQVYRPRAP
jgi:hypothetical protein